MAHICERLVNAAQYLQQQGMTDEQLRALHHPQKRPETFAYTIKYFSQNKAIRRLNQAYADRVIFVAEEHRKTREGFQRLAAKALERLPL